MAGIKADSVQANNRGGELTVLGEVLLSKVQGIELEVTGNSVCEHKTSCEYWKHRGRVVLGLALNQVDMNKLYVAEIVVDMRLAMQCITRKLDRQAAAQILCSSCASR
jgi:hypothetical protein